ncbi:TBC domain containing protein [Acanthamoeba castellanii str. Neff]|uniref:TBC domain containing protein n=1 Tax=Acanthamoeba castellanii (strain ATCC 30010 / Neff) TaxID=1257118 RepID=L8GS21_ACACF|nr:TBC domain containing protein [Acanthamoeba castellanii str. Neff]ELR15717.1 TBC domain containing protein [Acanthamoeba castellanii str. Neff]
MKAQPAGRRSLDASSPTTTGHGFYALPKRIAAPDATNREKEELDRSPPPVTTIVNRLQALKSTVVSPQLCRYIDVVKSKHDRLLFVSEHYSGSLSKELFIKHHHTKGGFEEELLGSYAFDILRALAHLHDAGVTHRNISSANVLLDPQGGIRLADYGLHFCTRPSKKTPNYFAPELIATGFTTRTSHTFYDHPSSDIWAFGILFIELTQGQLPWHELGKDVRAITRAILDLCGHEDSELEDEEARAALAAASTTPLLSFGSSGSPDLYAASYDPFKRQNKALMQKRHKLKLEDWLKERKGFTELSDGLKEIRKRWLKKPFLKCSLLKVVDIDALLAGSQGPAAESETDEDDVVSTKKKNKPQHQQDSSVTAAATVVDPLGKEPVEEIYHFWKLAGGDIETELASELRTRPPILRIPRVVPIVVRAAGKDGAAATDNGATPPTTAGAAEVGKPKPKQRGALELLYKDDIMPIFLHSLPHSPTRVEEWKRGKGKYVPMELREKDIDYQRHRVKVFRDLLQRLLDTEGLKVAKGRRIDPRREAVVRDIVRAAAIDIPQVLRAEVWTVLLGLHEKSDDERSYDALDKEGEGPADRQIDLDIPRCHQYNPLLASPEGHRKLRRLLKAWVLAQQGHQVYWQGLDSLLAPFLTLNFEREARAYWCLHSLTSRYLPNFFLPDNTIPLQEHLATFRQLLAYHDPQLATHLADVGFQPDLYSISWFLTLFAHIFPLDQVYKLWDVLLVHSPALTHFIAVAILHQLRTTLLPMDFNHCIILFSGGGSALMSIDLESTVRRALAAFRATPPSIYTRKHIEPAPAALRWWEQRMPLDALAKRMAPSLSLEDLVSFREPPVVIDVRAPEAFARARYPGSVNVSPRVLEFSSLNAYRGRPVVVIAEKGDTGYQFANRLVRAFFPLVSTLAGGIDVLVADATTVLEIDS